MDPTLRVLVVEDEPDILDGVAEALTLEGFAVETARDGADALAHLGARGSTPLAAVVVDVMMPRLTGPEFVREARRKGLLRGAPVITLTASRASIEGEAARVQKPFDVGELIEAVHACATARA